MNTVLKRVPREDLNSWLAPDATKVNLFLQELSRECEAKGVFGEVATDSWDSFKTEALMPRWNSIIFNGRRTDDFLLILRRFLIDSTNGDDVLADTLYADFHLTIAANDNYQPESYAQQQKAYLTSQVAYISSQAGDVLTSVTPLELSKTEQCSAQDHPEIRAEIFRGIRVAFKNEFQALRDKFGDKFKTADALLNFIEAVGESESDEDAMGLADCYNLNLKDLQKLQDSLITLLPEDVYKYMEIDGVQTDLTANVWISLISSKFGALVYSLEEKAELRTALQRLMAETVSDDEGTRVEPGWELIGQALDGAAVSIEDVSNRLNMIYQALILSNGSKINLETSKAFKTLVLSLNPRYPGLKDLMSDIL